jgi:hypothetical protein
MICAQDLRVCIGTAQTSTLDVISTVVKDPTMTLELRIAHHIKCWTRTRDIRCQDSACVEKADL